jgi:P pilus assembly chaperone PapD
VSIFTRTPTALVAGTALAITLLSASTARADGMVPQTSVVIVNEADREASLNVTNSDKRASLLLVTLVDIDEDKEKLLRAEPLVSRVEAGKTQTVRFMLQAKTPLKTQRLKRVLIEGIPDRDPTAPGTMRIGIGVRQNLPVIIHPAGLPMKRDPWTLLTWSHAGNKLTVRNDSAYVVRLAQDVRLLPGTGQAMLPRAYVLPGETITVDSKNGAGATKVKISPATVYGYVTDAYETALATAPVATAPTPTLLPAPATTR